MFSIIVASFLVLATISLLQLYHPKNKLPPGPMSLSIIGHLPLLGNLPYRAFRKQSTTNGPIMSIYLDLVKAIVVSSLNIVRLFLKTYDAIFASRPKLQISKYLSYGSKGIALAEYDPYLRDVLKFCMVELLSDVKIDSFATMRRGEIELMVEEINIASENRKVVNLSEKIGGLIEGMICRMFFGRKDGETFVFRSLVDEIMMACHQLRGLY